MNLAEQVKAEEVRISNRQENNFNCLEFKVTGRKIAKSGFEGFPFIKRAMSYIGGEVICTSREKEFTSFVLKFPEL